MQLDRVRLLVEDVNSTLVQCVQKRLSRRRGFGFPFERAEQHRLRAGEGFTSNAGRPFLQHEFRRSLGVHNDKSLADLACFDDHRLSPTRHIEILPLINVADGLWFLRGNSHEPA
ncbi:hypothetical protein FBZ99_101864 [Rhizobium sp. ERR 1071]|nr:hypothetical protein FBZ99_101864 [Rhizobium sp. ERR1071]